LYLALVRVKRSHRKLQLHSSLS